MGVLEKLYLEFPKVFWGEKVEIINPVSQTKGMW